MMHWYKGVRVGKGSALAAALDAKDEALASKLHKTVLSEFYDLSPENRRCTERWFRRMNTWPEDISNDT